MRDLLDLPVVLRRTRFGNLPRYLVLALVSSSGGTHTMFGIEEDELKLIIEGLGTCESLFA